MGGRREWGVALGDVSAHAICTPAKLCPFPPYLSSVLLTLTSMFVMSIISMYNVAPLVWYGLNSTQEGLMLTCTMLCVTLYLFHFLAFSLCSHFGDAPSLACMHTRTHTYVHAHTHTHNTHTHNTHTHAHTHTCTHARAQTPHTRTPQAISTELPHCTSCPLHHSLLWWTGPIAAQGVPRLRPQCDSSESTAAPDRTACKKDMHECPSMCALCTDILLVKFTCFTILFIIVISAYVSLYCSSLYQCLCFTILFIIVSVPMFHYTVHHCISAYVSLYCSSLYQCLCFTILFIIVSVPMFQYAIRCNMLCVAVLCCPLCSRQMLERALFSAFPMVLVVPVVWEHLMLFQVTYLPYTVTLTWCVQDTAHEYH